MRTLTLAIGALLSSACWAQPHPGGPAEQHPADQSLWDLTPDGPDRLEVGGHLQFRYQFNQTSGSLAPGADPADVTTGFDFPRARLGVLARPNDRLRVRLLTDADTSDNNLRLLDAWIEWELSSVLTLRAGQSPIALLREFEVGAPRLQSLDRSINNSTFGLGRSQIVNLRARGEDWFADLYLADGDNALNSTFDSPREDNLAVGGRFERRLAGEWLRFREFTSFPGEGFAAMVGGGAFWSDGDSGRGDELRLTADLNLEGDGWNLFLSANARYEREAAGEFTDLGVVVQGGRFVSERLELFARYEAVIADNDRPATRTSGGDTLHAVTAGFNWYVIPRSQALKFSFEVIAVPSDQSDSIAPASRDNGLVASSESQLTVRGQVQLLF